MTDETNEAAITSSPEESEAALHEIAASLEEDSTAHGDGAPEPATAQSDEAPQAPAAPHAEVPGESPAEAVASANATHVLPAAETSHVLPAAAPVSEPAPVPASDPDSVPVWPFVVYAAIWIVFAALIVARFSQVPQGQPIYEIPEYPMSVLGGLTLSIAGPLVILTAWFGSWGTPGSTKWGLFVSALIKGSLATTFGVALWWFALIIVDQVRMGRVL